MVDVTDLFDLAFNLGISRQLCSFKYINLYKYHSKNNLIKWIPLVI